MKTNNATAQIIAPLEKIGAKNIGFHHAPAYNGPIAKSPPTISIFWKMDGKPHALKCHASRPDAKQFLVEMAVFAMSPKKFKADVIAGRTKPGLVKRWVKA